MILRQHTYTHSHAHACTSRNRHNGKDTTKSGVSNRHRRVSGDYCLGGGQLLSEEARGLEGGWDSLPKSRNSGALSATAGHK